MGYPNTNSILANSDGSPRTGTSLSTNIIIKVGNNAVGALQSVTINETRDVRMVDEVGTDGSIDSVPVSSSKFTGTATRIRFDRQRITEAFSRGYLHIHAQRIPFLITIIDTFNGDAESAVVTTLNNCWLTSISYNYQADNFIITDNMNFSFETISSQLGTGTLNAATGGERGIPLAQNEIEKLADSGKRRGSLDSPGLLRAVTTVI